MSFPKLHLIGAFFESEIDYTVVAIGLESM